MLKIDNIRVTVDNKEVVKGVSLEINPGEIHALMGPNGSGKSSLAMALMGHPAYQIGNRKQETGNNEKTKNKEQRTSTVELDGEDITDKTPDERARMGLFLASQYPVGVGGVTVEQLLRSSVISSDQRESRDLAKRPKSSRWPSGLDSSTPLGMTKKSIDVLKFRKDLEKLADKVGVSKELLKRSINVGFSGGEKKRLEVLQMLTLQPKYAILDETDSGLDIDALKKIAEMVRMAKWPNGQKPGILVITHYTRLLHYLKPSFVHIMKDGKIVESGGKEVATRIEKEGYVSFRSDSARQS